MATTTESATSTAASASTVAVRAPEPAKHGKALELSSQSLREDAAIDRRHVFTGCGGKNESPQLSWTGAPKETKSYAITCFDPDAPTGSGFWHWVAFDIPASTTLLESGAGNDDSAAGGKSGRNDFGLTAYAGPCPPKGDGDHRYIFRVYALDVASITGAGKDTSGAALNFMMRGHVLATGTLTGRFGH
ncbi:MAG: YbhB/YbcL family Raf kinase inhibitor-like protein [Gemmatimonadales bacterium]